MLEIITITLLVELTSRKNGGRWVWWVFFVRRTIYEFLQDGNLFWKKLFLKELKNSYMYALMFKLKIKIIPLISGIDNITKEIEKVQISGNFFPQI